MVEESPSGSVESADHGPGDGDGFETQRLCRSFFVSLLCWASHEFGQEGKCTGGETSLAAGIRRKEAAMIGGWAYVRAAYVLPWLVWGGYALMLWRRHRRLLRQENS